MAHASGMHALAGMSKLEELNIGYTGVGDTGVASLGRVTSLRVLNMDSCDITDGCGNSCEFASATCASHPVLCTACCLRLSRAVLNELIEQCRQDMTFNHARPLLACARASSLGSVDARLQFAACVDLHICEVGETTAFAGRGLLGLTKLRALSSLNLSDNNAVRDIGLENLTRLCSLKHLDLSYTGMPPFPMAVRFKGAVIRTHSHSKLHLLVTVYRSVQPQHAGVSDLREAHPHQLCCRV